MGDFNLNVRKWLGLFFTTFILGGIVALATDAAIQWKDLLGEPTGHIAGFIITAFIMGLLFSGLSQMGFFAYLTIHRIGLGIFKSHNLWSKVQLLLVVVTFFDLGYFRAAFFGRHGAANWVYWLPPVILLGLSLIVAEWKKKETNRYAFVPTLFLMFVVTVIEWVPALKQNGLYLWVMGITLFVCNTYQVMRLHRLLGQTKSE